MKRPFVVTGSVRSGTTLISRCLAAHSQVVCPSDPAFGFFRSFRNALREHSGVPVVDPDEPLTDFFPVPADYLSSLMSCDLRIPLFKGSPSLLQSEIAKFAAAPTNAPSILPRISEIDADSYADAFQQLLGVFEGALGSKKTECSGFKQTWIEAFVPALFRTFERSSPESPAKCHGVNVIS